MKKIGLSFVFVVTVILNCNAVDRIVKESGPVGTYSSIVTAVTAANDGDVIIVTNKPGNIPWSENVVINKSLTFVSADDNQLFLVNGTYYIERATGRVVTINGMKNTSASTNVTYTNTNIPPTRTLVKIINSELSGVVDFNVSAFNLQLITSVLANASVVFQYGSIIGSSMKQLIINNDAIVNTDTIFVIGNKIIYANSSISVNAVYSANTSQLLYFSNNYIYSVCNSSSAIFSVVYFSSAPKAGSLILNSTLQNYWVGSYNHVISNYNGILKNSVLVGYVHSSCVTSNYDYNINNYGISGGGSNNIYASSITINSDGSNAFPQATNAGDPSNFYLDLDLTRNDMGCYGGSYSLANFFSVGTFSSKVNFVKTPRIVNQGNTFSTGVIGSDK